MIKDSEGVLDLDGVLVDLDGQCKKVTGKTFEEYYREHGSQKLWNEVFTAEWFIHADPMPGFDQLLKAVFDNFERVKILTALPYHRQDLIAESMNAKFAWVRKHIGYHVPVTFGPLAKHKQLHVDKHSHILQVLIDDMPQNCHQWREAGGFAIEHITVKNTIEEIELLKQRANSMRGVTELDMLRHIGKEYLFKYPEGLTGE